MDDALVLGDVAGGEDPRHRVSSRESTRDPAPLAELEAGAAGEHHVGHRAGADHDRIGLELEPATW